LVIEEEIESLKYQLKSAETMLGIKVLAMMDVEAENIRLREVLLVLAMINDPEEKERIARKTLGLPEKVTTR